MEIDKYLVPNLNKHDRYVNYIYFGILKLKDDGAIDVFSMVEPIFGEEKYKPDLLLLVRNTAVIIDVKAFEHHEDDISTIQEKCTDFIKYTAIDASLINDFIQSQVPDEDFSSIEQIDIVIAIPDDLSQECKDYINEFCTNNHIIIWIVNSEEDKIKISKPIGTHVDPIFNSTIEGIPEFEKEDFYFILPFFRDTQPWHFFFHFIIKLIKNLLVKKKKSIGYGAIDDLMVSNNYYIQLNNDERDNKWRVMLSNALSKKVLKLSLETKNTYQFTTKAIPYSDAPNKREDYIKHLKTLCIGEDATFEN